MRNTIYKSVVLPAPAADLYDMYMDPEVHAAFTGAPVKISDEPGSAFEAFGGLLLGTMLQVVKPLLIVQSWRSVNFAEDDAPSYSERTSMLGTPSGAYRSSSSNR